MCRVLSQLHVSRTINKSESTVAREGSRKMSENIKQGDEFSWIHVLEKDDGEPVDLRMASAVYAVAILYGESVPTFNKESVKYKMLKMVISV